MPATSCQLQIHLFLYSMPHVQFTSAYAALQARQLEACSSQVQHTASCSTASPAIGLHTHLQYHQGCVNTATWSRDGFILTGSDDREVAVWRADHALGSHNVAEPGSSSGSMPKPVQVLQGGFYGNVFSALALGGSLALHRQVLACARCGNVSLLHVDRPDAWQRVFEHDGSCHKLDVHPANPALGVTGGADGVVAVLDTRQCAAAAQVLTMATTEHLPASINQIALHPTTPHIALLACTDAIVRTVDLRMPVAVCGRYCPSHLRSDAGHVQATGAVWSAGGESLVATYNDEDVYTFDAGSHAWTGAPALTEYIALSRSVATECQRRLTAWARPTEPAGPAAGQGASPARSLTAARPWNIAWVSGMASDLSMDVSDDLVSALPKLATYQRLTRGCMSLHPQWAWWAQHAARFARVWQQRRADRGSEVRPPALPGQAPPAPGPGITADDERWFDGFEPEHSARPTALQMPDDSGSAPFQWSQPCNDDSFERRFRGHRNCDTIKGVNFFGSNSRYVLSGSDEGHVLMWDRRSGQLVQAMLGDRVGAVNNLQPHPSNVPLLLTSGLEHTAAVWSPQSDARTLSVEAMRPIAQRNLAMRARGESDMPGFLPMAALRQLMQAMRGSPIDSDSEGDEGTADVPAGPAHAAMLRMMIHARLARALMGSDDDTDEGSESDDMEDSESGSSMEDDAGHGSE